MKKSFMPRIGMVSLVILVAGVLVYGFLPKTMEVDVAVASKKGLEVTVDDDGETRVRERYIVTNPVSGNMMRVELHPGDRVEKDKGALLAIQPMDPNLLDAKTRAESEARVEAAEAAVQRAKEVQESTKESLELAGHEYERAVELIKSNSIARADFDQWEHRYFIAQREVRAANSLQAVAVHELAMAKAAFLTTQDVPEADRKAMIVPSPIDGVVLRVMREDAGFVPAGSPILEIGNPEEMELKVDVLSTYATKIKPGNPVLIERWGGDHSLAGVVRIVEPSAFLKISALGVEEKRVNIIIDFKTPWNERQSLGDGFRVEARIVVERSSGDTVVIPNGAIFREGDQRFTYRDDQGVARKTPIHIGLAGSRETEILEGIAPDDVIIVYPSDKIRDGTQITHRRVSANR